MPGIGDPSSLASSPVVPTSAKKQRVKRRVINLVNPADPDDFSHDSISITLSPNTSTERENETPPKGKENEDVHVFTPLGINKDGVRGILRPSGTPGSGNGVRFFPKNKFRIITPNQSLLTPSSPAPPPPPSPTSNSFLSQLLAVTVPSITSFSPRRNPPPSPLAVPPSPSIQLDDSWEQPGQEGEISLIASSPCTSAADLSRNDNESFEDPGVPWSGIPEIHSSPLCLPREADTSKEPETSLIELPSVDWHIPVDRDISDLLAQQFCAPEGAPSFDTSLAISEDEDIPRPALPRIESTESEKMYTLNTSIGSASSGEGNESNPTIRRPLPPVQAIYALEPHTPPKETGPQRGFSSIFADMSAEQADMSWPLVKGALIASPDEKEDDTVFHSTVLSSGDISISPVGFIRSTGVHTPTPISRPSPEKPGDMTQFFDCSTSSPSFLSLSLHKYSLQTSSSSTLTLTSLIQPTQAVFEAHNAQTSALRAELALYRNLAEKLQSEVVERDEALVELNLRVLEDQASRVSRGRGSDVGDGDRTTVIQGETRDSEIRLAKALSDQEAMARQIVEGEQERKRLMREMDDVRRKATLDEEKARDALLKQRNVDLSEAKQLSVAREREEQLQDELSAALERCETMSSKIEEGEHDAAEIQRLEGVIGDWEEVKMVNEEEMARLSGMLEKARRREGSLKDDAMKWERQVEGENARCREMQSRLDEASGVMERLEDDKRELKRALHTTRAELATVTSLRDADTALHTEISSLRAQSASKDLEIASLQRRKGELKDDLEMLNIALDSKQQELELMKRKFLVTGIAGSTPLGASRRISGISPSIAQTPAARKASTLNAGDRRRSSMAFVTPSYGVNEMGGKVLRGGAGTGTLPRSMRKVDEENREPERKVVGSLRRNKVLA